MGFLCLWLSAISSHASASASCAVPATRTLDNQTVYGTMYAVSGKPCNIMLLRTSGPIQSTRLVAKASRGNVSISGNRVTYVSRQGFAGDDHFIYARQGSDMLNRPITRTVDVTVKVAAR
jgi:hypothetical protein